MRRRRCIPRRLCTGSSFQRAALLRSGRKRARSGRDRLGAWIPPSAAAPWPVSPIPSPASPVPSAPPRQPLPRGRCCASTSRRQLRAPTCTSGMCVAGSATDGCNCHGTCARRTASPRAFRSRRCRWRKLRRHRHSRRHPATRRAARSRAWRRARGKPAPKAPPSLLLRPRRPHESRVPGGRPRWGKRTAAYPRPRAAAAPRR
mmetsp:Transcript_98306/g.277996  ORF Transcript_98306/g.277996 Transcript_98306/m.277996 type:complete len:203 (-) Transcript_98306:435-1043(-)